MSIRNDDDFNLGWWERQREVKERCNGCGFLRCRCGDIYDPRVLAPLIEAVERPELCPKCGERLIGKGNDGHDARCPDGPLKGDPCPIGAYDIEQWEKGLDRAGYYENDPDKRAMKQALAWIMRRLGAGVT